MTFTTTRSAVALVFAALWFTGIPHARADSILVNQVAAPTSGLGGFASLHAPNINILSADNFKLDTGAFITGMQWQGSYDSLPPDNFINQFVVTFWSDVNGLPGSVLQAYTFSGKAGETFVATDQFGFVLNNYAVIFPTAFTVHNGVTYWLSVQALSDLSIENVWRWRSSIIYDGRFTSTNFGPTFQKVHNDAVFSLTGTTFFEPSPVPEPSTLLLFSTGLMAALGHRHFKTRKPQLR